MAKVGRWDNTIFPRKWRQQRSYQTECFFLHTDHKLKATWWANKGGDHHYSKQLTGILPINWIDNLLICKAQDGKGHGRRFDMGEKPSGVDKPVSRPGKTSIEDVTVQYVKEVKSPYCIRGKVGETRTMPRNRAERLEAKGKVKIISEVQECQIQM